MRSAGTLRIEDGHSWPSDSPAPGVWRKVHPDHIDEWLIAPIEGPRGTDAVTLSEELARADVFECVSAFETIAKAYAQACDRAAQNDRIIVFGSFHTVAQVMAVRAARGAAGNR